MKIEQEHGILEKSVSPFLFSRQGETNKEQIIEYHPKNCLQLS